MEPADAATAPPWLDPPGLMDLPGAALICVCAALRSEADVAALYYTHDGWGRPWWVDPESRRTGVCALRATCRGMWAALDRAAVSGAKRLVSHVSRQSRRGGRPAEAVSRTRQRY